MKKIISVLLIALLCAGMMPAVAFADEAPAAELPAQTEETLKNEAPAAELPAQTEETEENEAVLPETEESDDGLKGPEAPKAPEAPEAPAAPDLEGLSDEEANARIAEYNEQVDAYNREAEEYNLRVAAYEEDLARYNEQVEAYNAEAVLYNAEAEAHNSLEDEKQAAYDAVMEKYNQRLEIYNKNVATIERLDNQHKEKIQPQMEMLGEIGRVDAESILSLGSILSEDYYVKAGRRDVQIGRAGDLVISWDDLAPTADHQTIQVNAGADQSGTTYKVANLHIYQDFSDFTAMNDYLAENGWDCMNINVDDANNCFIIPAALIEHLAMMEFEIVSADANDSVTVKNQYTVFGQEGNLTNPRFLDGYTDGSCWYPAGTVFMTNAADYDSDWTGTAHTFSFENGTCDRSFIKNTLNINSYVFNRYKNPEPVKPEAYEAQRMSLMPILSSLDSSLSAISGISRMDLREILIPVQEIASTPEVVPAPVEVPAAPAPVPVKPQPKAEAETVEETAEVIEEEQIPMATPSAEEELVIDEQAVPLVSVRPAPVAEEPAETGRSATWPLLNLILSLLSVLAASIRFFRRRSENAVEIKAAGFIPAAASVILFVLTSDLRQHMALVNQWTPLTVIFFAAAAALLLRRKDETEEAA